MSKKQMRLMIFTVVLALILGAEQFKDQMARGKEYRIAIAHGLVIFVAWVLSWWFICIKRQR